MTRTARIVSYKVNGSIYNTSCAVEILNKITELDSIIIKNLLNQMDTMVEYEMAGLRHSAIIEKVIIVFPVEEGGVIEL